MTPDELKADLEKANTDLGIAIQRIKYRHPEDPWIAQDPNGRYILVDALAAKAQVLAALGQFEHSREPHAVPQHMHSMPEHDHSNVSQGYGHMQ